MKRFICNKKQFALIVFCMFALLAPCSARADVPLLINYQGYLTDSGGTPLSGSQLIYFRLYNTLTGGTDFWDEQQTVDVTDGVFNVQLGAVSPLVANDFNLPEVYLEIQIFAAGTGWETLTPRQKLTSAAFAIKAGNADMLDGLTVADLDAAYVNAGETNAVTSAMIADNSISAADLGNNSVGTAEISAGAVTSTGLADSAVTAAKLAPNSVGSGQVIDNSLTAADLAPNSVGSSEVTNNSLTAADLAANSVTASEIAADAVGSSEITDGSVAAADLADDYVNTTGDAMTGDLSIGGNISVSKSSDLPSDYTATFESSGGNYAYAINGIANSADSFARGLDLNVDSANSAAYGARINADSYSTAYGLNSDATSTHGSAYGAQIYSTVGSSSTSSVYGIYNMNYQNGTGNLYGIRTYNYHNGTWGDGYGLYAFLDGSDNGDAKGVYSEAHKDDTGNFGVVYGGHFIGDNDRSGSSYGVLGEATGSGGTRYGVYGRAITSGDLEYNYGVYSQAASSNYFAYGYRAEVDLTTANSAGGYGSFLWLEADSASTGFLYGGVTNLRHYGGSGSTIGYATTVHPSDSGSAYGIYSQVYSAETTGVAYAGYFLGNVYVSGTLSKGGGSFKIDHPLDPESKYLQHSFVESPDMMNVYNGNVELDAEGEAWVQLPAYFQALNMDFRYQLTALGAPGPNLYIAEKISDNRFKIAGGQPNMEVSWQVTGIRQDAWAQANRIQVEVDKNETEQGSYLYPEAYGLDATRSVEYARDPDMVQQRLDMEKSRNSGKE
jgi:hypothetical protein